VVIGGIISSTFLTLLVLPALYRLVHRAKPAEPLLADLAPAYAQPSQGGDLR
jgi:cobalt-zinc-cadmium resistance protein CzcA